MERGGAGRCDGRLANAAAGAETRVVRDGVGRRCGNDEKAAEDGDEEGDTAEGA